MKNLQVLPIQVSSHWFLCLEKQEVPHHQVGVYNQASTGGVAWDVNNYSFLE